MGVHILQGMGNIGKEDDVEILLYGLAALRRRGPLPHYAGHSLND